MSDEHLRLLEKEIDTLKKTVTDLNKEHTAVKVEQKGQEIKIVHLIEMVEKIDVSLSTMKTQMGENFSLIHDSMTNLKVKIGKVFVLYCLVISVFTSVVTFFTLKLLE